MNVQNVLTLVGLSFGMAGAYLMYSFTPKVNSSTFLYTAAEEQRIKMRDARKNRMVRLGMLLLFVSFVLQATALVVAK